MRRKLVRFLVLFMTMSMFLVSCEKTDKGQTDEVNESEFVLADNVIILDESDFGKVVSCDGDNVVMTVSSKYDFAVGRIFCCPITESTPYGFAGRIVEIVREGDRLTLKTEPVGLEDIFDELHVDGIYDVAESIESSLSDNGKTIVPETVPDTVWNWLSESHADSMSLGTLRPKRRSMVTKGMVGADVPVTVSLPVKSGGFEGNVYVKCGMNVSINISRTLKIKQFNITINRQTGVEGKWTLMEQKLELKKEVFSLEHKMKPMLIPGTPIAIVPSLYTKLNLEASAESEISASMRYQFENTTYTYSYRGGTPSFDSQSALRDSDRYFRFLEFSTKGQVSASFVAGGKLSLWNEKVLAVGSEAEAGVSFEAESAVSMKDKDLLVSNPMVSIRPSADLSLYCESLLFKALPGSDDGRFSKTRSFNIPEFKINIFPKKENVKVAIEDAGKGNVKTVQVESEMSPSSLLRCEETGFAVFDGSSETEAIVHQKVTASSGDSPDKNNTVSCELAVPKDVTPTVVKPYVVHGGRLYYGKPVRLGGRLISKIEIRCSDGYFLTSEFQYDEKGRIMCETRTDNDVEIFTGRICYTYSNDMVYAKSQDFDPFDEWYKFDGKRILSSYNGEDMIEYSYAGIGDRPVGASCKNAYSFVWNWDEGNMTRCDVIDGGGDGDTHDAYEYLNIENKMNIDFYDFWEERYDGISFFDREVFSNLTCRSLLNSSKNCSYSYAFDENGDVKSMSVSTGKAVDSVEISYYE